MRRYNWGVHFSVCAALLHVGYNSSQRGVIVKTKRNVVMNITAGLALPVLWIVGVSDASARPPRSASSTVTRTGPSGNTATRQSNVSTNGAGGYNASSTVTGPAGNTATRQQSGAYDPATKTYSRSATTTGPGGKQSSSSTSVQATGNGYQRNATHTGPNGNSVTSQGQATYDASTGTVNQSRTTTGPNGKTATESRTVTVPPK
jgi:hypothetical protein